MHDDVRAWIAEHMVADAGDLPIAQAYAHYMIWCAARAAVPQHRQQFTDSVRRAGIASKRKRHGKTRDRYFLCARLVESTPRRWPSVDAFDAREESEAAQEVVEAVAARVEARPTPSLEARPVESLHPVEEHRLKSKVRELEARNKSLLRDLSDAQEMAAIIAAAAREVVPPIAPRERTSGIREGTALAMASDWHIEEEVRPEQVAGRNRYNLDISARRMERFFESVRWAIDFNRQAFAIRDLILWLGGDIITGFLHDDNRESNLLTPPQALAYAQASIVSGIRYLLQDEQLERIVIPCNDGNHGRMTDKMRSATRTAMSLETMLYGMIAREFTDERRVQFQIAEGAHLYYGVYGRMIRFMHGDDVRYGGGVGGVTIPLLKAIARYDTVVTADLTCLGHFHQRICLPSIMVNSSLIGYSPYALTVGARFEAPSQNFAMLDPQRFHSIDIPLWVSSREDDEQEAA